MNTPYISKKGVYKVDDMENKGKGLDIYSIVKRGIDITLSVIAIVILAPLSVLISILICADSKGNPIFKQARVGMNGKIFNIYKFRSMQIGCPNVPTSQMNNSGCEVTKIGKFLRKTSLDEIPQLFNILKGDMSFVGPRPVISSEGKLVSLRKKCGVDKLYPGITGWAQINGRDEIDAYEKVKYDYEYLNRKSLFFDIYIMFITIIKVVKAEGIKEGNK